MKTRDLKKDTDGGIEGLPLQLMIVILVATLGTAVILGWMGSIDTPQSIGEVTASEPSVELEDGNTIEGFYVTVLDQDRNPLTDAVVRLNGLGVSTHAETNDNGIASFEPFKVNGIGNNGIGTISIDVFTTTHGEHHGTKVVVIA